MTAEVVAEGDGASHDRIPRGRPFLDGLVVQLSEEYGVDQQTIRRQAAPLLAYYADARVKTFVAILVEKRLREQLRGRRGRGGARAAGGDSVAAAG